MKGNYPLNTTKLHRVLLELLAHPEVKVTFRGMRAQQGLSNWFWIHPPTAISIEVDANQQTGVVDHIATVVHELLHVVALPMWIGRFDDDLDEVLVLALDAHLTTYIRKSPKRTHAWVELINKKLMESEECPTTTSAISSTASVVTSTLPTVGASPSPIGKRTKMENPSSSSSTSTTTTNPTPRD